MATPSKEAQDEWSAGYKLFEQKKFKNAASFFKNKSDQPMPAQAQFQLGVALYEIKKYKEAFSQLGVFLDIPDTSQKLQLKSLYIQWKILQKSTDTIQKMQVLSRLIEKNPSPEMRKKARQIATNLIAQLDKGFVDELLSDSGFIFIHDLLAFKKARNSAKNKKYRKALAQFKDVLYSTEDIGLQEKARRYIQALAGRTKVYPRTIGAVLPLTGPHKKVGRRCLNGLQLGLGISGPNSSDFKLVVVDSKGSSLFVREAVKDIFLKHAPIGLVGGVVSQSAVHLAKEAQNFMIPTVLLSQKAGLTSANSFVFQNAVTSGPVVQNLVSALIQMGHKKFAILYPNDPFGVEYANAFWTNVENKGGEITGAQTYKPGETDFNGPIERLIGTYYFEDRDEEFRESLRQWFSNNHSKRNNKKLKGLLPPAADFSVLFIPDSIKSLHHIAPYISFKGIDNMTLAGPGLWHSPRLLKHKKEELEGLVFASALITDHPKFKTSSFFNTFKSVYGHAPGLFEFLAYQSGLTLRHVIVSGRKTREDLQEGLVQIGTIASPVGPVEISPDREFIYPVTHFKVQDAKITEASL